MLFRFYIFYSLQKKSRNLAVLPGLDQIMALSLIIFSLKHFVLKEKLSINFLHQRHHNKIEWLRKKSNCSRKWPKSFYALKIYLKDFG